MSELNREIGTRIKGIRELSDLSVEELASKINMPPERLSEYESGNVDIPVSVLHNISSELKISMTELLTGEEAKLSVYSVVRRDKGVGIDRRSAYNYKSLAYNFANRKIDPFLITIPVKPEGEDFSLNVHSGQELHLLSGRTDFSSYAEFYKEFKVNMPENFNFGYDIVDEIAKTNPDKTAIVWCNDMHEEKIISFAEVKRMSDKMANALTGLGINKGDVVMVMLKRRYEYWYLTIAMHKIGAVLIPATHLLTVKDLVYRINAADVKMIISVDDQQLCGCIDEAQQKTGDILKIKSVISGERDGYINFNHITAEASEVRQPVRNTTNKDTMIAYFTSGTTGMPKMVAHDYLYPLCHITTARFWHNLDENDLHLTVADTGWAKTSWGKIYGQWICESAVFVYDYGSKFKPSDFLELIDKHKITSFCAPPTIYRFLIKEDLSVYSLESLKKCTIAGEPLNPEVYYQWLNATGLKLREGYGQTECTVLIATNPWCEPKPGSMGLPMPGSNCCVMDINGNECEAGEEGELCVPVPDIDNRPLGLFMGYFRDEELTKSVLFNGIYHTGDSAWKDEDGYIWFKGRNDDIIKSSGYRIWPFEVESALLEHPAVLETAITGVPDPDRGYNVKATVVLAKGYEPSNALVKELQDHVKRVTAPYKYPRIIEFVTELPKTISGKIRRVQIREEDAGSGQTE
ncbi:acyl-coenzyme a synthetase [Holotrichia oblita]|nr:acyl-coenzyme a synthetase [Holotrichia oblita]